MGYLGFGLVLLFLFALDLYVFQGFKVLISTNTNEVLVRNLKWVYWSVSVLLPVLFMFFMFRGRATHQIPTFGIVMGHLWLMLFVSKLVFVVFLMLEDGWRVLEYVYLKVFNSNSVEDQANQLVGIASRRKFISNVALGIAGIPFFSLLYGVVAGKYNFKVHKLVMSFKDLPEAFNGFTITQISDVHSGSFTDREGVLKGLQMVKDLKSDLMVFTGDLVNTFSDEFDPWIEDFKELKAPYGQFSILGNHDYGDYAEWNNATDKQKNFERTKAHHETIGFKLLLDESVRIAKDDQEIYLMGVENWGKGFGERGDLYKAISQVKPEAFKILLSHDPTHWEFQVKKFEQHIHLTLSGHTHGMQMGVELPGFRWSPAQYRYPKWAGLYSENNRFLYINRGFGVLGFRGRAGIWPEITQIELRREV